MPEIKITNLVVKYPPRKNPVVGLDKCSVSFKSGQTSVILGKSGCGKTTLLRTLCGVNDISEGEIYFDDVDIKYLSIKNRNIGYVDQSIRLYPHLLVFNNIAYPLTVTSASSEEIKARVFEVAKLLKIENLLMRKPRQLSLGQAQRVAIAKAIIKEPNVYLFDEAFSNLDEDTTFNLIADLKAIFKSINATVIFVTHNKKEAFMLGDYFYTMKAGQVVDQGTLEEYSNSSNETTQSLLKD